MFDVDVVQRLCIYLYEPNAYNQPRRTVIQGQVCENLQQ